MKLLMTLFMAALFSFGASYAHACGVDAVSGKTDTTITISWNVNCNKFEKFEICWKKAANSGNVCNSPTKQTTDKTGSYIIEGLSPSTPYKIKTHWHRKSRWYEITTRIVTTNPSPAATTMLRYEKQSQGYYVNLQNQYVVYFFWTHVPTPKPGWELVLWIKPKGVIVSSRYIDVKEATYNSSTLEYGLATYPYSNNRTYVACLGMREVKKKKNEVEKSVICFPNSVEWK